MKIKHIECPILNDSWFVAIVYAEKPSEVLPILEHYGHDIEALRTVHHPSFRGLTFTKQGCTPVINLPRKPKTAVEIGTLAHEACHAIESIFDAIDQPLGDEVFAHSVGAVVRFGLS